MCKHSIFSFKVKFIFTNNPVFMGCSLLGQCSFTTVETHMYFIKGCGHFSPPYSTILWHLGRLVFFLLAGGYRW